METFILVNFMDQSLMDLENMHGRMVHFMRVSGTNAELLEKARLFGNQGLYMKEKCVEDF